ncbi:Thymidylate kinase [Parafrankia irregularis]|uniref:Thymidylate kinase n=1 Tax=Parafrankia irregularis TaxID=795642 RepID=A0A0S4QZD5_9ACTN|nr:MULTISPECIES: AAA family ATPase [Parafrankia]MBE3206707.1 AAA family ATPase [Parafrankia sp. CH37]CUU60992.1 Thymidylate kinase [Parafrankia irregularis]
MTGPLVVVEGMPGAGKTTLVGQLAAAGWPTVGEYTTPGGETLALAGHPPVGDDAGHQGNWLRKATQAGMLRDHGPVVVDRDWTTSLAYAASIADTGLLAQRARWAAEHLHAGDLRVAEVYVVLDIPSTLSITRRAGRHRDRFHPWWDPDVLDRLRAFYTDPPARIAMIHPALGAAMATARWHHQPGDRPTAETGRWLSALLAETVP